MATVAKRPKRDKISYYVDTAQGKFRIKKYDSKPVGWFIYNANGPLGNKSNFRTLTDAVTYIEEGWHTL